MVSLAKVNATKDQKISLKKIQPGVEHILIGAGWDPIKSLFESFDLDLSVICLDSSNRCVELIFFNHEQNSNRSIIHGGDNLTGFGAGDDELIEVKLRNLPSNIVRLKIIINIYKAKKRKQHFGKVKNCFVHVQDMDSKNNLVYYEISGEHTKAEYNDMTGMFVAELYRRDDDWEFKAEGKPVNVDSINQMVNMCENGSC